MSFVAQKLGFLKCNNQNKSEMDPGKRITLMSSELVAESSIRKKRKISTEEDSSESSSLSLGKLKIADSSESDPSQSKNISIPIALRPKLQTKSVLALPEIYNYSSISPQFALSMMERINQIPYGIDFPPSEYLKFLIAPYGTPTKFIGPITAVQRKEKVDRYLEKKRTRHWKNVKYTVRQQLAQGRKRAHGRFVKSQRKWRWNQIPVCSVQTKPKQQQQIPKSQEHQKNE